ncbi:MAG TPA: endonuclease domain-containing protein [Longimicrobium sp.]|nr:endonuclease domain-containing protein [Longimicrobium sp.]
MRSRSPELQQQARLLRGRMTMAEQMLWQALRMQRVEGARFRRQHAIDRFILDFYCPALQLCIEVDGEIHAHQRERDEERTRMLSYRQIRVLRFTNSEVLTDLPGVLDRIRAEVATAPGEREEK